VNEKLEGYCCGIRLGFQSKACSFVSNGVGNIDAQCNVEIYEHILDLGRKYLFWA